MAQGMRIRITENGPYIVEGNVPLFEKAIRPKDGGYVWEDIREIPHGEVYALCRCGRSRSAPFCDGSSHKRFRGKEKADTRPYDERCRTFEGPGLVLKDDERCSLSRFCHRAAGKPWALLPGSDDPVLAAEIARACIECPSGRLTAIDLAGKVLDQAEEPQIWIIQDPEKRVSGGIYVRGPIPIVGADGREYEVRNRSVLCRCGRTGDMPFCDASHINAMYRDDR
ncbi:MAG: CDGSH iron-sulfur domain-containing protein [Thermoplasmata archaeon]|nr:CDGSH iron-sulfur domain-containing protein [Thermoplasmata archaeon]